MMILEKMDKKRLKDDPKDDQDCNTHECAHCKKLLTFPWKTKEKPCSMPISGLGSHRTVCAQRYLDKWCYAEGRASISQCTNEKIRTKEEHEESATLKA